MELPHLCLHRAPPAGCPWKCHKSWSPTKSCGGRPGLAAGEGWQGPLLILSSRWHSTHRWLGRGQDPTVPALCLSAPRGQSRRPHSSTYREVCEGYTCGGKGTVIRPHGGLPHLCGPPEGLSQWLGEGLVTTSPLWWRASTSQDLVGLYPGQK